jgi:hypothetical protein
MIAMVVSLSPGPWTKSMMTNMINMQVPKVKKSAKTKLSRI